MAQNSDNLSRREILRLALLSPLAAAMLPVDARSQGRVKTLDRGVFANAPTRIVPLNASDDTTNLKLTREWQGNLCRARLTNTGTDAVHIKEVILFDIAHELPAEAGFYGEGFQMLSQ